MEDLSIISTCELVAFDDDKVMSYYKNNSIYAVVDVEQNEVLMPISLVNTLADSFVLDEKYIVDLIYSIQRKFSDFNDANAISSSENSNEFSKPNFEIIEMALKFLLRKYSYEDVVCAFDFMPDYVVVALFSSGNLDAVIATIENDYMPRSFSLNN